MFSLFNKAAKKVFKTVLYHQMLEFGDIALVPKVGIKNEGNTHIELVLYGWLDVPVRTWQCELKHWAFCGP